MEGNIGIALVVLLISFFLGLVGWLGVRYVKITRAPPASEPDPELAAAAAEAEAAAPS